MISLRHLEVFHAIMRTGSVTGAARMLNVSQPAVSAVLRHAEARLKIRLFVRSGGRLTPTPEAVALLPEVEAIFGRLDAMNRQIQDLAGGRLGALSLAGAFPIANGYLAKAVASFVVDRPQLRVTLQSLTSPQVIDRVAIREAELGVAYETFVPPELSSETLVQSAIACVMPESHPLARRREIALSDLRDTPIITYLPQTIFRTTIDRALGGAGVISGVNVQVGLSLTGMVLAYHGAGIALVEPFLLASMPFPGLVVRPLRPRIEMNTMLVWPRGTPRSAAAEAFVAQLKQTIDDSRAALVEIYGSGLDVGGVSSVREPRAAATGRRTAAALINGPTDAPVSAPARRRRGAPGGPGAA